MGEIFFVVVVVVFVVAVVAAALIWLLESFANNFFSLAGNLVNGFISCTLVFQKERPHDAVVDEICAIVCGWIHAPHKQDALQKSKHKQKRSEWSIICFFKKEKEKEF